MAVTTPTIVGGVSSGQVGTGASGFETLNLTHTVVATADYLVVYVANNSFTTQAPEVTWLGTSVPLIHDGGGGIRPFLYCLLHPTAGTGTLSIFHNHAFGTSIAAVAFNLKDFAGIRFVESTHKFYFDANPETQTAHIYAQSTDLVVNVFSWLGAGQTATPDAGQALLIDQSGTTGSVAALAAATVTSPVAVGVPPVQANDTEVTWTLSAPPVFNSAIAVYVVAFMGLDGEAPVGSSEYIARVTNCLTPEQQPRDQVVANASLVWKHEVPTGFETLVVLVTYFDSNIQHVYYTPVGGVAQELTQLAEEAVEKNPKIVDKARELVESRKAAAADLFAA